MLATSKFSCIFNGGKILESLDANKVLPVPGGPLNSNECPPAAAISKARRGRNCPFTSTKSNAECDNCGCAAAITLSKGWFCAKCSQTCFKCVAAKTSKSGNCAASCAFCSGKIK